MSWSKLKQFYKINHLTYRSRPTNQPVVKNYLKKLIRFIPNLQNNIVLINAFVGVSRMTTNVFYMYKTKTNLTTLPCYLCDFQPRIWSCHGKLIIIQQMTFLVCVISDVTFCSNKFLSLLLLFFFFLKKNLYLCWFYDPRYKEMAHSNYLLTAPALLLALRF